MALGGWCPDQARVLPTGRLPANGGARVGRFRQDRIRHATSASVIAASTRMRPPQRGQQRASTSKTRWRSSAHRVRRVGTFDGASPRLGAASAPAAFVVAGRMGKSEGAGLPSSTDCCGDSVLLSAGSLAQSLRSAFSSSPGRPLVHVAGAAASASSRPTGLGTTRSLPLAHGASSPWYRTGCARGGGISGASRSSNSWRSIRTWAVPSRHRVFSR